MKDSFERFCKAIDRAYSDNPQKKAECARIFAENFERLFRVALPVKR